MFFSVGIGDGKGRREEESGRMQEGTSGDPSASTPCPPPAASTAPKFGRPTCASRLRRISSSSGKEGASKGEVVKAREALETMRRVIFLVGKLNQFRAFLNTQVKNGVQTIPLYEIGSVHGVSFSAFATNCLASAVHASISNFVDGLVDACTTVVPTDHTAEERPQHALSVIALKSTAAKVFWEVLQDEDLSPDSVHQRSMDACASLWTQLASPAIEEERSVLESQMAALEVVMAVIVRMHTRCAFQTERSGAGEQGEESGEQADLWRRSEVQKVHRIHASRLRNAILRIHQMQRSLPAIVRVGMMERNFLFLTAQRRLTDQELDAAASWVRTYGERAIAFCHSACVRISALLSSEDGDACWRAIDVAADADPSGRVPLQPPSHLGVFFSAASLPLSSANKERISVGPAAPSSSSPKPSPSPSSAPRGRSTT